MSLVVSQAPDPAAPPVLTTQQQVAPADIERIKNLLIDGKRAEAVTLYATLANVSAADAETAVDNVFLSAYSDVVKHLPLAGRGFLMYGGTIAFCAAATAVGVGHVLNERSLDRFGQGTIVGGLLASIFGALMVFVTIGFLRHLGATITAAFGAIGHARILRSSVVRAWKEKNQYFMIVIFEVKPDDGSAIFVDQETVFVGDVSRQKLVQGNVIRVRFDGGRRHVYPVSPITVLSSAAV